MVAIWPRLDDMEFDRRLQRRPALLAAGVSDAEVRGAVDRGHLVRLTRGAYLRSDVYEGLRVEERYALRAGAEAARSPGLVISHAAAAAVHGLPLVDVEVSRVHLTRPGRGGSRVTSHRVVHAGALDPEEVEQVDGVPVTGVPRTLLDLARSEPMTAAVVATDAALRRELVTPAQLEHAFTALRGYGIPAVRRAWLQVDGRAESPGESLLRLAMTAAGLPAPQLQVRIEDDDGRFLGRTDLGLLDAGVLLEFDGRMKYGRLLRPGQSVEQAVLAEKRREEGITGLGWLVIRVTWAELRDRGRLARRIQSACRARQPWAAAIRGRATPREPVTLFGHR